jgi:hypothetical protein
MSRQPKAAKIKLPKGVTQEFVDSIQSMTSDQLKAAIVQLQVQTQENEAFKDDPKFVAEKDLLDQAKARFELIAGPVKETAISLRNRTQMIVQRLQEKGSV